MGITGDMITMCGVSVLLLHLLSLTVASPVTTQSDLEVQVPQDPDEKGLLLPLLGLYGLYSLYEHLFGSTPPTSEVTTLAPEVTTPAPGVTTPTPDTTTKKSGLFGWWPNNGGFLGFGLFGKLLKLLLPPLKLLLPPLQPPPRLQQPQHPLQQPPQLQPHQQPQNVAALSEADSCFANSLMKSRDEVTKNIVKITLNS